MDAFDELASKIADISVGDFGSLDLFDSLKAYFSQESVQNRMLDINTEIQLMSLQEDSRGNKMPTYADKTARHKRRRGLPDKNYTYYETGKFYDSLEVYVDNTFVMIAPSQDAPEYVAHLLPESMGIQDNFLEDEFRDEMIEFVINDIIRYFNGTHTS